MAEVGESSLGFVTLRSGETALLSPRQGPLLGDTSATPVSAGVIYTEHNERTLEDLLEQYEIITAVLERPVPSVAAPTSQRHPLVVPRAWEVVVFAGISGAVSAIGWTLLVAGVVSGHLRVNPYIALLLALGGLVLVGTVAKAAKPPSRE